MAGKEKAKKIERQDRLPGMADAKIQALHGAALDYAEIRDERQALTVREVELKTKLIELMHKHGRDHYEFENVKIDLVIEEESVKVKVKKPKEAELEG